MVRLRSGKQTICEDYDLDYCRHFLAGEYPDFSLFTLLQLRQLKRFLETNFDTIHYEVANDRHALSKVTINIFFLPTLLIALTIGPVARLNYACVKVSRRL